MNNDIQMMLNMRKLAELQIMTIKLNVSKDVRAEYQERLDDPDDYTTSITLSCIGFDSKGNRVGTLGFLEAIHSFRPITYGKLFYSAALINLLFTDEPYRNCGIASMLIDVLPNVLAAQFGILVDVLALTPAPQIKNEQGDYVQVQGVDFWLGIIPLIKFYEKYGFEIVNIECLVKEV